MCGIAGFVGHKTMLEARAIIERMMATLVRSGPDDQGTYVDQACALVVRRLAVIDLPTGHQPVSNEDGTIWVVQNGEIYNFRTLRDQLRDLGHVFRTQSDTEVIVHAYEAYGEDCVTHLEGMFAFAVWDSRQHLLLLGRDRMGEKPLYYHAGPDAFVFGSELRALLSHPVVPCHLDLASLERYLAFEYIPTPHSILAGVEKLAPGHVLTVSPSSKPHVAKYWDLSFAADPTVGEQEWQEALLRQLGASVRAQLATDMPLGLFLSGGVDSSGIVALASLASSGQRMKTFSLGFIERSYDERPFAEAVARACGTEHREVEFSAADASELLERAGDLLDEPLADGSFLPIYRLSQVARREVTVVLSGDGGDELFCGYPTFQADKTAHLMQRLPPTIVQVAARAIGRLKPSPHYGSAESLLKRYFRALPHSPEIRTQLLLGGLTATERWARGPHPVDAQAEGLADKTYPQACAAGPRSGRHPEPSQAGLRRSAGLVDAWPPARCARGTLRSEEGRSRRTLRSSYDGPARRRACLGRAGSSEGPLGLADVRRVARAVPARRAMELRSSRKRDDDAALRRHHRPPR